MTKNFMNEHEELTATPVSKINSAFLINLRIDAIIKDLNRHSRSGRYHEWNDDLDRLWLEIGSDTPEGSPEELEYEKLTNAYLDVVVTGVLPIKKGFSTVTTEQKNTMGRQKLALMKKEMFLRRLINKQGKGTAYQDNSDDYMDN